MLEADLLKTTLSFVLISQELVCKPVVTLNKKAWAHLLVLVKILKNDI